MKNIIGIALVIAFVVDLSVLVGVGAGAGVICLTNCQSPAPGVDYTSVPYWPTPGTLNFSVQFENVAQGSPLIISPESGQVSTDLLFQTSINVAAHTSCANGNSPAWYMGQQAHTSNDIYYEVNFNPQPSAGMMGTIDGAPFVTNSHGNYFISENTSGSYLAYCQFVYGSGDETHTPGGAFFEHTLALTGPSATTKVTVSLYVQGQYCGGQNTGTQSNACAKSGGYNNGGFNGWATASAVYQSAGATVTTSAASYQNGGTLTAYVTTGYDAGGYRLAVYCPSARPCSGSVDTSFTPQSVCGNSPSTVGVVNGLIPIPDNEQGGGCTVTWSIPKDAGQNNTVGASWNQWEVELTTQYVNGLFAQFVVINPLYSPGHPSFAITNSGSGIYPAAGDTVYVTLTASAVNQSGPPTAIYLSVFYLAQGQGPTTQPGCPWVTTGCPSGERLSVTTSGNTATTTFQFTVNPSLSDTGIGFSAYASSASGQASPISYDFLNIAPPNCVTGTSCNPNHHGATLWSTWGPWLTSIALVLVGLMATVWVPNVYVKVGAPVLMVVISALLFVTGAFHGIFQ